MRKTKAKLQAALALTSLHQKAQASLDAQAPIRARVSSARPEQAEARRQEFLEMRRLPRLEPDTAVLTANSLDAQIYGYFAKLEFAPIAGRPLEKESPFPHSGKGPNDEKYFHSSRSRADAIDKARSWAADHLPAAEIIDLTCLTPSSI